MIEVMRFVDFFSIVVDNSFLGTIYNIQYTIYISKMQLFATLGLLIFRFLDNNLDCETTRFRLRSALLLHVYNVTLTLVFV